VETILVIDDDMRMRRLISRVLVSAGYVVQEARNGREGVAAANLEPPDLVVCDITMPEMNGHRVLQTLREAPATAHLPFIFLTGWGERDDLRTGMNLGADDYLVKPVDPGELLAAVQARLRRKKQAAQTKRTAQPETTPEALAASLNVTAREAEIVSWVLQGKTNPEMAIILGIQLTTVKKHLESIFTKLGVQNRTALVTLALQKIGE
jgi:DNA-binding NarL/FixJ family response regulator